jgi:hypothetical protein
LNCDDGWEKEWDEAEQGDSMMLLMFSSGISKADKQTKWIYDHIVWDNHVQ